MENLLSRLNLGESYGLRDQSRRDEFEEPGIKNVENTLKVSPYLNMGREWEDFNLPKILIKSISEKLCFHRPSKIQAVAIPLINKVDSNGNYENLVAQSKNGTGKTGSFVIGSLLRVNQALSKIQVVVFCHTREMVNQVFDVYKGATALDPNYSVANLLETDKFKANQCQVVVTTLGKFNNLVGGRSSIDVNHIKCIIIDEADYFLTDPQNQTALFQFHKYMVNLSEKEGFKFPQYILFSATFPDDVQKSISILMKKANQIKLSVEQLALENIQQYYCECPRRSKLDFIKAVFEVCVISQTVIFVNTKTYAETIHIELRKQGYKSNIIFSNMTNEERDLTINKFRLQEINVLIATNILARGIDVPEIDLVINFDVPGAYVNGEFHADSESYLHRIGRAGRFGRKGVAVTLLESGKKEDEEGMSEIIDELKLQGKIMQLEKPQDLEGIMKGLGEDYV